MLCKVIVIVSYLPGGSISYSVVLHTRNINEDLRGRILHGDCLQDSCTIVGDGDAHIRRITDGLKNFIHSLRPESRFNHISNGNSTNKRRHSCTFTLFVLNE